MFPMTVFYDFFEGEVFLLLVGFCSQEKKEVGTLKTPIRVLSVLTYT